MQGLKGYNNGLVQVVADNFDANISSQNGLKSTHALAMLLTQPQPDIDESSRQDDKVRHLKQHEMKGSRHICKYKATLALNSQTCLFTKSIILLLP